MRRILIACPSMTHGLGNRMRLVLSAQALSNHAGRKLLYAWPTGPSFGAALTDLWAFDEQRIPARASARLARWYPYRDETLAWAADDADAFIWQVMSGRELSLPAGADDWREHLRRMSPADNVARRVRSFHRQHFADVPYVGVMIRANAVSHEITRRVSPVDWYIEKMRSILAREPQTKFFLSCDDASVTAAMLDQFPSCVSQHEKGAYNSRQALVAAVSDLYLLASAYWILGPHWSSFVHLADYLAGGMVTLETSMRSFNDWAPSYGTTVLDPILPSVREP